MPYFRSFFKVRLFHYSPVLLFTPFEMMYDWVNFFFSYSLIFFIFIWLQEILWCWRLLPHKRGTFEYVFYFLLVLSLVLSRVEIYHSCTTAIEH
jgi:hypothetical protein